MADIRIKDLSTEVASAAPDDYLELDGATNGSRKIKPGNLGLPHYATRPGLISAGTSAAGTTQDNTGLDIGAGNQLWLRYVGLRPSHGTLKYLATKFASNLGWKWEWDASDILRLRVGNGTNFTTFAFSATVATGLTADTFAEIDLLADFAGGTLDFYVNGAKRGATVDVSAAVAQDLDNTGPLLWGSDGTTHFFGTYSEGLIAKTALPTATQIANFYRAGNVAPFCTWSLNSTTGQYEPALGSVDILAWPYFGSADPINNPIAYDLSGNNQHALIGTTGLTAAVPLAWCNTSPRHALVGDGSNGSFIRATLNTQNPGTGDAILLWEGIFPQDGTSTGRTLAALTSSTSDVLQGKAFTFQYATGAGLQLLLYGATSSDYRRKESLALYTLLTSLGARGVTCALFGRRLSSGVSVFLGIGRDSGRFYDVTYLFSEVTSGTPPAWTAEIDGDYIVGFYRNSTTSSAHTLSRLDTTNVAMTEAQLRTEYERGEPGPEWVGASKALLNNATCVNSSPGYDTFDGASATGFHVVRAGTGTIQRAQSRNTFAVVPGQKYRFAGTLTLTSGSAPLALLTTTAASGLSGSGVRLTAGAFDIVATVATAGNAVANFESAAGDPAGEYTIADLSVTRLGYTARLRTDLGGGFQAPNDAVSATNDSTHFELSTSGVTWAPVAPIGARVSIVRTYTHSAISSLDGTTLFGTLPPGWAVADFQVNVTAAFDAGRTISFGTSGTPTRWVNGLAVDSTGLKQSTPLVLVPSSLTGNTSMYLKKSSSTTVGDLVTANVVIERKY